MNSDFLLTKDEDFTAFVATMPNTHWAKYDLSAIRLGWEAQKQRIDALELLALELATEYSISVIDTNTVKEGGYRDTDCEDVELTREIRFLELIGKLRRHPEHPNLVQVKD